MIIKIKIKPWYYCVSDYCNLISKVNLTTFMLSSWSAFFIIFLFYVYKTWTIKM